MTKDDIVFDIGSAEGNFALSIVERAKEVYLFEVEEEWIKALELTFAPYMDKVHIIRKYVSESSGEKTVSVDDFCKAKNSKEIGFLKMDVEGAERNVLLGARKMIKNGRIRKAAVCVYHKLHDEKELGDMFPPQYRKTTSEGYMLAAAKWSSNIWDVEPPYYTRGVMRVAINEK